MWEEAAAAVGASFSEPAPRLFEFDREGLTVHVLGQRTPFADPVSIELASAKDLSYTLLTRAGVRVPEHVVVRRGDQMAARSFLETGPVPVVVKPARGGGAGLGVTPSIETASQLERALRGAGSTSERLIVERQAVGNQFRILLLDGKVLDVIRRGLPQVVGDGSSTIEELMFAEYDRRLETDTMEGMKPFLVDLDCLFTLERQGLHLSTRLPKGTTVVVKSTSNISGGQSCVTVREPRRPRGAARGASSGGRRRCAARRRRCHRSRRRATARCQQRRRARGESDSRPATSLQRRRARSSHPGGRSGTRGAIRGTSRRGPTGVAGRAESPCDAPPRTRRSRSLSADALRRASSAESDAVRGKRAWRAHATRPTSCR